MLYMSVCYLSCNKEDFISNMLDGASSDTEAYTREDVGVVSLTRVERRPILQGDRIKWTATGKDAPSLQHRVF